MNKQLLSLFLSVSNFIPKSILSEFNSLQLILAKASLNITFQVYMGLTVFASLITGALSFTFSLLISSSAPISVLIGLIAFFLSIGVCYALPYLNISSKARKIDANLPLVANFLAVLASAGMPPERIFRSLAKVGDEFGVGIEARRIIADIELLGVDLNTALKNGSVRSASKKFGEMLDGVVTTSHMGGDLAGYLREESEKFKKARVASMKSFVESLGGIAEVYVSLMIALPMALVVMLSIMSFLGGGASMLGNIDPQTLLLIVSFLVIPAGVGMLILIVDSMTPPR